MRGMATGWGRKANKREKEALERVVDGRMRDIIGRAAPLCMGSKRYPRVCTCGVSFVAKSANRRFCDACSPTVQYTGKDTAL